MNKILNIIKSRRTIRKFDINKKINRNILENMVDVWRLYPSRMNKQPLEFIVVDDDILCKKIFENILWGIKNEVNKVFVDIKFSPVAYIVILHNKSILPKWFEYDVWASAQNMMLYAHSLWIGSVFLHSILRKNIWELLEVYFDIFNIDSIIWLWYPKHFSEIVELIDDNKYYIDNNHNIYVPKKNLNNVLHINKYGNN